MPVQRKIGLQPPINNTPGRRWETFEVQSRPSLRSVPGTNRPFGGPNWPHLNHLPEVGSGLPSTWGAGHLSGPPALRPQRSGSSLQAGARSPPPEARVSSLRLVQWGTGPVPRGLRTREPTGATESDGPARPLVRPGPYAGPAWARSPGPSASMAAAGAASPRSPAPPAPGPAAAAA